MVCRLKCLNVKPQTIKFLGENIGGNLCDLDLGEDFLDLSPKHNQNENFCSSKDINKTNRQATDQGKICANHISDERLVSTVYKELPKFNKMQHPFMFKTLSKVEGNF